MGTRIGGDRCYRRVYPSVASGQDTTPMTRWHCSLVHPCPLSPGSIPCVLCFLFLRITPLSLYLWMDIWDHPWIHIVFFPVPSSSHQVIKPYEYYFLNYLPNWGCWTTCKYHLFTKIKANSYRCGLNKVFFQSTCHQGKNSSRTWVAPANVSMHGEVKVTVHPLQGSIDWCTVCKMLSTFARTHFLYYSFNKVCS